MILYLHSNYNGGFSISEKINNIGYFVLISDIDRNTKYKDIINLVMRKFYCKKLVIDLW